MTLPLWQAALLAEVAGCVGFAFGALLGSFKPSPGAESPSFRPTVSAGSPSRSDEPAPASSSKTHQGALPSMAGTSHGAPGVPCGPGAKRPDSFGSLRAASTGSEPPPSQSGNVSPEPGSPRPKNGAETADATAGRDRHFTPSRPAPACRATLGRLACVNREHQGPANTGARPGLDLTARGGALSTEVSEATAHRIRKQGREGDGSFPSGTLPAALNAEAPRS